MKWLKCMPFVWECAWQLLREFGKSLSKLSQKQYLGSHNIVKLKLRLIRVNSWSQITAILRKHIMAKDNCLIHTTW